MDRTERVLELGGLLYRNPHGLANAVFCGISPRGLQLLDVFKDPLIRTRFAGSKLKAITATTRFAS